MNNLPRIDKDTEEVYYNGRWFEDWEEYRDYRDKEDDWNLSLEDI